MVKMILLSIYLHRNCRIRRTSSKGSAAFFIPTLPLVTAAGITPIYKLIIFVKNYFLKLYYM